MSWDEKDTSEWDKTQHGKRTKDGEVKRSWHQARNDAQDDSREQGASRTNDWKRNRDEK